MAEQLWIVQVRTSERGRWRERGEGWTKTQIEIFNEIRSFEAVRPVGPQRETAEVKQGG